MRTNEGSPQLETAAVGICKGGANAKSPPRVSDRRIGFLWMVCYRPQPFRETALPPFVVAEQSYGVGLNKSICEETRKNVFVHMLGRESAVGTAPHRGLPMTARWRRPGTSRCSDIMTSWSLSPHSFYAESLKRDDDVWAGM